MSTNATGTMNAVVNTILAMNPEQNEERAMADDWNSLFTLRLPMLPTEYIPESLG